MLLLVSEALLNGLALCLVTRLVKKSEHVLLVSLNTRLVERIDLLKESADAASLLKEVDELTEVVSVKLRHVDADVRHTAVNVSEACAQLCHLVDLVHTLALEEVQTVKVLVVVREEELLVRSLYADNSLEDGALDRKSTV